MKVSHFYTHIIAREGSRSLPSRNKMLKKPRERQFARPLHSIEVKSLVDGTELKMFNNTHKNVQRSGSFLCTLLLRL